MLIAYYSTYAYNESFSRYFHLRSMINISFTIASA